MRHVEWVFLDVGNILLDEDPLTYFVFRAHVDAIRSRRPELGFGRLLAEREACALAGSAWPVHDVARRYLDPESHSALWNRLDREVRRRFADLSPPVDGARELVEGLASRYRLGLIANQGPECVEQLGRLGFLNQIELRIFSEEVNLFKPDERLFQLAVEQTEAEPGQCLMVGDRLDNDIAPAQRVGMATAWIRWPCRAAKGNVPGEAEAASYWFSLERVAAHLERTLNGIRPTLTLDTLSKAAERIDR